MSWRSRQRGTDGLYGALGSNGAGDDDLVDNLAEQRRIAVNELQKRWPERALTYGHATHGRAVGAWLEPRTDSLLGAESARIWTLKCPR